MMSNLLFLGNAPLPVAFVPETMVGSDCMKQSTAGGPCMPKKPPISPLSVPAPACTFFVVGSFIFWLKSAK